MPDAMDIIRKRSIILSVFFLGLFVLKRTARATPEFISNPESIAPDERTPAVKSSVTITLEAQFGIIPTIAARTFARMGLFNMMLAIFSSPMK